MKWRDLHKVYINLNQRPDRKLHMEKELAKAGITAERVSGMLPSEYNGPKEKIQRMLSQPGTIGCHYSHIKCMEQALALGKSTLIMEDDLIICSDIQKRLDYIENFLNTHEWDIFWLGGTYHVGPPWWHKPGHDDELRGMCDCKDGKDAERTEDPRIIKTYGAFSTFAYIVNIDSLPKILKLLDDNVQHSRAIDFLFIALEKQLNTYAFIPGCVKQYDNMSNIGNGISYFSSFAQKLGPYWYQDTMEQFNPESYNWKEAAKKK